MRASSSEHTPPDRESYPMDWDRWKQDAFACRRSLPGISAPVSPASHPDTLLLLVYQESPSRPAERVVLLAHMRWFRYTSRDHMPKRRATAPALPPPVQRTLFPETVSLVRIRPAANEWRFYRMAVWPDLFGRALLVRHWGRIGTAGHRRLDPYPGSRRRVERARPVAPRQAPPRLPGSRRMTAPHRTGRTGKPIGSVSTRASEYDPC